MRQSVSLHINENILDKAALYATQKGISLSDLVEKLLLQAIRGGKEKDKAIARFGSFCTKFGWCCLSG